MSIESFFLKMFFKLCGRHTSQTFKLCTNEHFHRFASIPKNVWTLLSSIGVSEYLPSLFWENRNKNSTHWKYKRYTKCRSSRKGQDYKVGLMPRPMSGPVSSPIPTTGPRLAVSTSPAWCPARALVSSISSFMRSRMSIPIPKPCPSPCPVPCPDPFLTPCPTLFLSKYTASLNA